MANAACRVVAIEHLTLDGVYQAPACPDEDVRGGFSHGGWGVKDGGDPGLQQAMGRQMAGGWSLLVGSTTYDDLYEAWPRRQPSNPMTQALTNVRKFVASRDRNRKLPWANSILLQGEAAAAVAGLKQEHDRTLVIFGSGALVRSLMGHGLVDRFLLMIHPLVLGEGLRLFDGGVPPAKLRLVDHSTTDSGVLVATYELVAG